MAAASAIQNAHITEVQGSGRGTAEDEQKEQEKKQTSKKEQKRKEKERMRTKCSQGRTNKAPAIKTDRKLGLLLTVIRSRKIKKRRRTAGSAIGKL